MADLPFLLPAPYAERLSAAADVEGKIVRALEALGPLAGRDVLVLDLPDGPLLRQFAAVGVVPARMALVAPLRIDAPDQSHDVVISLWNGFRGVEPVELAEVDRVLRPGGRLLVVHDYGRDDVSALRPVNAPEYGAWSRRDGPFLRGGFKLRVIHAFWTFDTLDAARDLLTEAFADRGERVAEGLKRPRLSWNVAVYHRPRGGVEPGSPVGPGDAA